mgnify:CR=1 FL=1
MAREIKLQNPGLTRIKPLHIWPLTDAALPVFELALLATVANIVG